MFVLMFMIVYFLKKYLFCKYWIKYLDKKLIRFFLIMNEKLNIDLYKFICMVLIRCNIVVLKSK